LTEFEIRQILNYAYQQSGSFDVASVRLVLKGKEQIIKKSGILEIFASTAQMNDIGGLENLKLYLSNKAKIFSNLGEARKFGVDIPKGILIVGMQARALWQRPLRIYSTFHSCDSTLAS